MIEFLNSNALSKKQREEHILDLYFNQNKNYRQIAQEARMSPRDIGEIIKRAYEEKERQEQKSLFVQAYELFLQGKKPIEVAIILNIGEAQVSQYYSEYLRLVQLDDITQIYLELKGDIWYFVNMYKAAKSARMGIPHVINLLRIANNHLPSVQYRYEQLQKEINILQSIKENSATDLQNLNDFIASTRKTLDSIVQDCEKEMERCLQLQQQTAKQEAIVKQFENNNEEYLNLTKTVKDKAHNTLSNIKTLLELAILSLIDSMRSNPDKYKSLIYSKLSSTTKDNNSNQSYSLCIQRQQPAQYDYYSIEDCKALLLEEAEKFYNFLVDRFICEVINENLA